MNHESAIVRAVKICGNQSRLAEILNVKPQAVQKWCRTGRVPAERVLLIEASVNRAVTRHELRPDLYPLAA